MEQLITIETVPISIEYVEKKPMRVASAQTAQLQVAREADRVTIKSNPLAIKMDTFSRTSFDNISYTATAGYNTSGKLDINIQFSDNATSPSRFQQVGRGIENIMGAISTPPKQVRMNNHLPIADISEPMISDSSALKISFDMSALQAQGSVSAEFMPPDLELQVSQHPKVIVKYVGGPIYFPRSADPNYEPPPGTEDTGFDVKI